MKLLSTISIAAKMNLPNFLWSPAGLMNRDQNTKYLFGDLTKKDDLWEQWKGGKALYCKPPKGHIVYTLKEKTHG